MMSKSNITVTGLDLGSSTAKIAAVINGNVQTIVNDANSRETPNVVGLGQKQRKIGEIGKLQIKSNLQNTLIAPSKFLGFHTPCQFTNQQMKFMPCKVSKSSQEIVFPLLYDKKVENFHPQQLVSAFITEIEKTICQTNDFQNKNMVIAVPGYLTQNQRKAMCDAIKIARKGIKNEYSTQLVSEQVAISMDYGYSRRTQFTEDIQNPKNVLFIDLGHSKCNIFLTAFNKQHFRILDSCFDRQLGCKFMDWEILKFYAAQFDSKNSNLSIGLMESKKAINKILQRIQKQRKILSGINQAEINVECLLQGQDFYYTLTRQKFQQLCQQIINKFRNLLSSFIQKLQSKGIHIHAVQMIGGGTRIPVILNSIKEIVGQEPSRTLNSVQCISKGAALVSAFNSNIFRVQPFSFFQNQKYNIHLSVNGVRSSINLIEKNYIILHKDNFCQIEVPQNEKLTILAHYDQKQIENGLQNKIFQVEIQALLKQTKNAQNNLQSNKINNLIKVHFTIDPFSSLVSFAEVTSQSLELKVLNVKDFSYFTQEKLDEMQEKQKQMTVRDLKIKRFYNKKNEFQSKCYKLRNDMQKTLQDFKEYVQESRLKQIKERIQSEIQKLETMDIGEINHIDSLSKRENSLQQKITQFIHQTQSLKNQYHLLNQELKSLSSFIENLISTRQPNQYPQQVNQTGEWINSVFQKLQQSPKYMPPPLSPQEVGNRKKQLENFVKLFDQEMERKRRNSQRQGMRTRQQRQQQQYDPFGSFFRPHTGSHYTRGSNYMNPYENPYRSQGNRRGFADRGFF